MNRRYRCKPCSDGRHEECDDPGTDGACDCLECQDEHSTSVHVHREEGDPHGDA